MGFTGMCRCEGYGFQAVYSGMGYINQRFWVQNRVSFSQETDRLFKDFSLDQGNRKLPLKNIKIQVGFVFWLDCASDLCQQFLENSYSRIEGRRIWAVYSSIIGQKNSAELALVQAKGSRVQAAHPHPKIPKVNPPPSPGIQLTLEELCHEIYQLKIQTDRELQKKLTL